MFEELQFLLAMAHMHVGVCCTLQHSCDDPVVCCWWRSDMHVLLTEIDVITSMTRLQYLETTLCSSTQQPIVHGAISMHTYSRFSNTGTLATLPPPAGAQLLRMRRPSQEFVCGQQ